MKNKDKAVIGIIGSGTMGSGIAQIAASAGHKVLIYDASIEAAHSGLKVINNRLERLAQRGKLSKEDANKISQRIKVVSHLEEMSATGLVIEAIIESLEIKQNVFSELENIVSDDTILTSNTSSISITSIASCLRKPERFAGFHFFNPAPVMPLVELIKGLETKPDVISQLENIAYQWNKKTVISKTTPGFIVNRIARPFYAEALRVLEESVAGHSTIDAILRDIGDFKMGPFELMDLIGHDVNFAVTSSVFSSSYQDPRYRPSFIQQELVSAGSLGQKSGKGFYTYNPHKIEEPVSTHPPSDTPTSLTIQGCLGHAEPLVPLWEKAGISITRTSGNGRIIVNGPKITIAMSDGRTAHQRCSDEQLSNLVIFDLANDYQTTSRIALTAAGTNKIQSINTAAGLFQSIQKNVTVIGDTPGMIFLRTLTMLVNESYEALLLKTAKEEDLDKAMKLGANYPKGPLEWAKFIGLPYLFQALENIHSEYCDNRYRPSTLFRQETAEFMIHRYSRHPFILEV